VKSTSQTQVVRPRCRALALAWIVPAEIGRRKHVSFELPIAAIPFAHTLCTVASVDSISANAE
jgi:hypothetical protein